MTLSPPIKIGFWILFAAVFVGLVWLLGDMLTPFVLGAIIAYLLNPLMRRMTHIKIPRSMGALIILSAFFIVLGILCLLLGPLAFRQAETLISEIPNYARAMMDFARPYLERMGLSAEGQNLQDITNALKDSMGEAATVTGGILGGIATGGKVLAGFITTLILTPIVAFFLLREWPNIVKWVESLYPRDHETLIRGLLRKIDKKVAGFIRGQITVAFILGLFYAVAMSIAGLNYGFLIGTMAGLFSIIPLVGSTLGLVAGIGVAWFQTGDITYVAIIAGIFMFGQFIEGNFLSPKIVGDSVGLHPLWVIFALVVGSGLLGITGMLVAVPVAAAIGVLVGFAIERYKQSPLYESPPERDSPSIILEDQTHV